MDNGLIASYCPRSKGKIGRSSWTANNATPEGPTIRLGSLNELFLLAARVRIGQWRRRC
jgi:hypothetical protein